VTVYDFSVTTIDGEEVALSRYRGSVLLIVNVASQCGFTPQYSGLEQLYEKYSERGLVVLGFPSNQFMNQEPGSASEIKSFCSTKYSVKFPLFAKIDVNGVNAHPLYEFLKSTKRGFLSSQRIKWNFTKFLIDRQGHPVQRYSSLTKPEAIEPDILPLLR
jgi:glutathione peroxidase